MTNNKNEATQKRNMPQVFLDWLLNSEKHIAGLTEDQKHRLDPIRVSVFILFHLSCLAIFFVGYSWVALTIAVAFYAIRMFFITAFYHRYFSHRSYRVSRPMQFLMAILGCTAGQRGPLWWAGYHRNHHVSSDSGDDPHSPRNGFWNSHLLWFLRHRCFAAPRHLVRDWEKYPELLWLERFDWIPFIGFGLFCYLLGITLNAYYPALDTSGPQLFVWGFLVSTVFLYHGTYTINSLAHKFGKRRFNTNDDSRNNWWLAIVTLGEGWHNNHHRYPSSARQGFYWWEIDLTYAGLMAMNLLGLVNQLKPVPERVLVEHSQVSTRL